MGREKLHPAIIGGGLMGAIGLWNAGNGVWSLGEGHSLGALHLLSGAALVWVGSVQIIVGRANPHLTRAYLAFSQGKVADMLAEVEQLERLTGQYITRRNTTLLRTMGAFFQGDLARTESLARAAIAASEGGIPQEAKRMLAMQARSYLALSLALRAEAAAASEAQIVEQSPSATTDALARSLLARVVLLDRQGKRSERDALLRAESSLLLEASASRERALFRALRRKLRGQPATGYRQEAPGGQAPEHDSPEVEAWLRQVAPQVLDEGEAPVDEIPAEPLPLVDETPEQARQRLNPAPPPGAVAALAPLPGWGSKLARVAAVVGVGALLVWLVPIGIETYVTATAERLSLSPSGQARLLAQTMSEALNAAIFLPVIAVLVWAAYRITKLVREGTRTTRRVLAADQLIWRGRPAEALDLLARPGASQLPASAAQQNLLAARAFEHLARPADALARCEQGIALTSKVNARIATHDIIAPALRAERAFLLAVLDREDEAMAALDQLERDFPAHALKTQARFRVELIRRLRQGKLAEAAAFAAARPASLALGLREELLCDLLATLPRGKAAATTLDRLRHEISETPGVELWIDSCAPALLRALGRATTAAAS